MDPSEVWRQRTNWDRNPSAPGTDHDTNTSGTFTDVNLETRSPDRPVPPMAGTAAIGAVVPRPAAIEESRDLSTMSGVLADTAYRLPLTVCCRPDGPASLQVPAEEPRPISAPQAAQNRATGSVRPHGGQPPTFQPGAMDSSLA